METDIKEEKIVVLRRVPPGDRWEFASTSGGPIFASLTSALDAWFQKTQNTNFYIEARLGTVSTVKSVEVEKPITKYSLYGED